MPYLAVFYFSLLLCAILLLVSRVRPFPVAVFLGYLAIRTAFVLWVGMPQPIQLQLDKGAALFLLQMVAYWVLAGLNLRWFFVGAVLLDTLATILSPGGLLGNPSINGTFLACGFCLLCRLPSVWAWFTLAAILLTKASVPVGALAVSLIAFWIALDKKHLVFVMLAFLSVLFLGAFLVGSGVEAEFFSSSGRFEIWRELVPRYLSTANILIGSGGGSYQVLGPLMQSTFKAQWLHFFMHSDWLQVLLEFGIIGLGMALYLYGRVLISLRENPELFAVACALGAGALFNWPMHHPLTALLAVWVFRESLAKKDAPREHQT